jgi:hypothetical protein
MNRIFTWLSASFFLALLSVAADCRAQYYGADTARTLTERLQSVRDFPVGHPRLYDLQGYQGYRPYFATPLDAARHIQARRPQTEIVPSDVREEQVSHGTARIAQQRIFESKRQAFKDGFTRSRSTSVFH